MRRRTIYFLLYIILFNCIIILNLNNKVFALFSPSLDAVVSKLSFKAISLWERIIQIFNREEDGLDYGGVMHGTIINNEYILETKIQALKDRTYQYALPSPKVGTSSTSNFFTHFYQLRDKFNRGAHGELWHAKSLHIKKY